MEHADDDNDVDGEDDEDADDYDVNEDDDDNNLQQRWPPADGEVLAVHAVHLRLLGHPGDDHDDQDKDGDDHDDNAVDYENAEVMMNSL